MPSDGGIPFEDDDPHPAVHLPDDGRGRIHGVRDDAPPSAWAAGLPRVHSPRWQRPPPVMPAEPPADWVLPWWAERQLDPDSPAYAPEPSQCRYWNRDQKVKARLLANTRGRSWTFVGRPETLGRATVDPRGLLTWGAWSLDWWIRAGEQREALDDRVTLLAEKGPNLKRPVVGGIRASRHPNMKELRVSEGGSLRVLFAFDPRRHAILLLGGCKSGRWNAWYRWAVPEADGLYDTYLGELRAEGLLEDGP